MTPLTDLACGRPWCIAGGFAACPQLAGDCDVWVFVNAYESLDHLRALILSKYPAMIEEADAEGDPTAYGNLHLNVQKVGRIGECHVMVTDATEVSHLLDGFDVSTHQCAIDEHGTFIRGTQWTPLTQYPVALRETEHTPARMQKIAARYAGFRNPVPYWDMNELASPLQSYIVTTNKGVS